LELKEVAPPTKKHERMVKHIKKAYAKKGGLSDEEKSIAYATAWKNYNKKESFEINKSEHKKVQKKAKLRNLAKGNMNPNEKEAAEKKAGGPKLIGEGSNWKDFKSAMKSVVKKKDAPKHKYPPGASGGDAGSKAAKVVKDKDHKKYVNFLPANEQKIWDRLKLNIK